MDKTIKEKLAKISHEKLAAFKLTKREMSISDQLELARLYIDTSRLDDAIRLLESIKSGYDAYKRVDLLIEAYSFKGETGIVQQLRWDGFFVKQHRKDLFKTYYDDLSSEQEKKNAIDTAIDVALTWDTLASISMLFELNQPFMQKFEAI